MFRLSARSDEVAGLTLLGGPFEAVADTDASIEEPQCFSFASSSAYRYVVLRIERNLGVARPAFIGFFHVQAISNTAVGPVSRGPGRGAATP